MDKSNSEEPEDKDPLFAILKVYLVISAISALSLFLLSCRLSVITILDIDSFFISTFTCLGTIDVVCVFSFLYIYFKYGYVKKPPKSLTKQINKCRKSH